MSVTASGRANSTSQLMVFEARKYINRRHMIEIVASLGVIVHPQVTDSDRVLGGYRLWVMAQAISRAGPARTIRLPVHLV